MIGRKASSSWQYKSSETVVTGIRAASNWLNDVSFQAVKVANIFLSAENIYRLNLYEDGRGILGMKFKKSSLFSVRNLFDLVANQNTETSRR